jgi:hypothetical protein
MRPNLSQMEEDILETYRLALVDYDIPWTDELKRALTSVFELAADRSEEI